MVDLGTASSYAVLAGTAVTSTGLTLVNGDLGVNPGSAVTGFPPGLVNGAMHAGDAAAGQAQSDLTAAYNDAAGRTYNITYGGGFDLVGLTLTSGVYHDASSLFLSGTLTLDAQGNPDAVWIFQAGSTFITAANSMVALIGGAQACHVFWQVGSSATLGTDTDFAGNILALQSITLDTGTTVDGRVLARNGAVTLDNNTVTRAVCKNDVTGGTPLPDGGSTLLLFSSALVTLFAFGRQLSPRFNSETRPHTIQQLRLAKFNK